MALQASDLVLHIVAAPRIVGSSDSDLSIYRCNSCPLAMEARVWTAIVQPARLEMKDAMAAWRASAGGMTGLGLRRHSPSSARPYNDGGVKIRSGRRLGGELRDRAIFVGEILPLIQPLSTALLAGATGQSSGSPVRCSP
jgi:hypothetical protein